MPPTDTSVGKKALISLQVDVANFYINLFNARSREMHALESALRLLTSSSFLRADGQTDRHEAEVQEDVRRFRELLSIVGRDKDALKAYTENQLRNSKNVHPDSIALLEKYIRDIEVKLAEAQVTLAELPLPGQMSAPSL